MNPGDMVAIVFCVAIATVLIVWVIARYLGTGHQARAALTSDKQVRGLAEEYRRLSDLAITAQEHTDLRLTELSVRIDELGKQMEQLQHILKEVE
jgi:phage shock protein A